MAEYAKQLTLDKNAQSKIIDISDYFISSSKPKGKGNKPKGKSSEVFALRNKEEIAQVVNYLNKCIRVAPTPTAKMIASRNKLMFFVGINIGVRASDLRTLRWSFFLNKNNSFKDYYVLMPKKTEKYNKYVKLYFNNSVKKAIREYLEDYPYKDIDEHLFKSRKGTDAIEAGSLGKIVKDIAENAGIKQNIGSHSLRKTWGFWCWHEAEDKQKALVILQKCFNHSDTLTTMRYIGLLDDEIEAMYNSIELGYS